MRTSHFLVAGVLAVSFAAGCGSDDDTSDALSAVCESEEQVLEDLQSLADLDPATSSTSDYQAAVDALRDSVDDLAAAREDLGEQDVDNVQSTYESLQSDLEGLDDVPLAELSEDVGQAVQQSIQDLLQQYQTAYENSSCNS